MLRNATEQVYDDDYEDDVWLWSTSIVSRVAHLLRETSTPKKIDLNFTLLVNRATQTKIVETKLTKMEWQILYQPVHNDSRCNPSLQISRQKIFDNKLRYFKSSNNDAHQQITSQKVSQLISR